MNQLIENANAAGYTTLGAFFNNFSGASSSKGLGDILNAIGDLGGLILHLGTIMFGAMILFSAYLYVTSMGEEAKAETAKKTLIWSIVGFVLMGLASMIETVMKNTLK
jgi:hypothetical protein